MPETSRGRIAVATVVVLALAFSGCLTLDPSVTADRGESRVFERIEATESGAASSANVRATLRSTDAAANVTTITVIAENGRSFQTTTVESGETTVLFSLPTHQTATVVATNSVNSTTIETLNVTTDGDRVV